jgi:hypothetical protein
MANWDLTEGLKNLRSQVNTRFPKRDKKSDGTIGDAAHKAETSGHNPDDTKGSRPEWDGDADANAEVRAWDMDSDLGEPGVTAQMVVDHLRALPNLSSVLRYMIYNRKIYRAANGWKPEKYDGASAHTEHIHYTGAYTNAADSNTTFDFRLNKINPPAQEEDDMPSSEEIVRTLLATDLGKAGGGDTVAVALQNGLVNSTQLVAAVTEMSRSIGALSVEMGAIKDMVARIAAQQPQP